MCIFCRSLFVLLSFSFGHWVAYSSSMYGSWLPFGIFKLFFYQRPHPITLPNHCNELTKFVAASNHLIFTNGSTLLFPPIIWIVPTTLPCFPIQLLDLYVLSDPTSNYISTFIFPSILLVYYYLIFIIGLFILVSYEEHWFLYDKLILNLIAVAVVILSLIIMVLNQHIHY